MSPPLAETLLQRLLYRDGLMLVLDKPAGINVHAGPRDRDSLEDGFPGLRFGLPRPPVLAHRLDRDTSGCLVLARHPKAARKLARLFAEGRVEKRYWAVVIGTPTPETGGIDVPLRKVSTRHSGWRIVADTAGRPAVTDYRVLGTGDGYALLELTPRTGRTHQIRVHCAAIDCPILGDPLYGKPALAAPMGPGMHLHARSIGVPLYATRPTVWVTAPLPPHLQATLTRMGLPVPSETEAGRPHGTSTE